VRRDRLGWGHGRQLLRELHTLGGRHPALLGEAHKRGSLIEGLVLYASAIDALLRNLVALKTGERRGTSIRLDSRYFYHDDSKWMNERTVYKEARGCGLLTDDEFRELEELYRFRNIVVHRFAISGVSYAEIAPKLDAYEVIYERIADQLRAIEQPDAVELDDEMRAATRRRIAQKLTGATADRADSASGDQQEQN
jgi:hypothetical protein